MRKLALAGLASILLVLLALGGVVFVELGLRLAGFGASRGQMIDVELFPYKDYTVSSQPRGVSLGHGKSILDGYFGHGACDAPDGSTAIFNSDGFRGPEFRDLPPKESGEIRIVIVGGSAAVSWNIGEKCTLDSNLSRLLGERWPGRHFRIVNLGSGAWKSMQELISFQLHGLATDPDIVIAFDGFNDILHAYSMPYDQPYTSGMIAQAFERYRQWTYGGLGDFARSFRLPYLVRDFLASRASGMVDAGRGAGDLPDLAVDPTPGRLATKPVMPVDAEKIAARTDFDPWNRKTVQFYLRNVGSLARIASGRGIDTVLALQPTVYLRSPLEGSDRRVFGGFQASSNFTVLGYVRAREGLAALASEVPRTRYIDLSEAFNGMPGAFFGDQVHFNEEGYRIVAERLFEVLVPLVERRVH